MSKNMRSGPVRWLYLNVKSEDTSMAMRVTSPSDQKRTAVTLAESGAGAAADTPAHHENAGGEKSPGEFLNYSCAVLRTSLPFDR